MARLPSNLIEELVRFPIRRGRNEEEDRLTIALAALLRRSDVICRYVAVACVDVLPDGSLEVRTHAPAGSSAGFIDLELRLSNGLARTTIWIEAKLESRLSGADQLEKYSLALPKPGYLVLLAPARYRSRFADHVGAVGATFLTWEQIHEILRSHAGEISGAERFLLEEVLSYMEQKGLSQPTKINAEDLLAFKRVGIAFAGLDAIFRHAAELIAHGWGKAPVRSKSDAWIEEYAPPRGGWHAKTRFAWGFHIDADVDPFYWVGIHFDPTSGGPLHPTTADETTWSAGLLTRQADPDSWNRKPDGRTREFLTSWQPLTTLTDSRAETIDDQGEIVAAYVLSIFNDLRRSRE